MKIPFTKNIEVESEVDIDIDDITNALQEQIVECNRAMQYEGNRGRIFAVSQAASFIIKMLRAITDAMIETIPQSTRNIVAEALRNQSVRWGGKPRVIGDDWEVRRVATGLSDEDIKAKLIRMRLYFIAKGAGVGECAAWCELKQAFAVGVSDEADEEWLESYQQRNG